MICECHHRWATAKWSIFTCHSSQIYTRNCWVCCCTCIWPRIASYTCPLDDNKVIYLYPSCILVKTVYLLGVAWWKVQGNWLDFIKSRLKSIFFIPFSMKMLVLPSLQNGLQWTILPGMHAIWALFSKQNLSSQNDVPVVTCKKPWSFHLNLLECCLL